ncbi:migration and invasion-inhibitory protein [Rana temporaria]|uniref:migration and invasion-inhibitory protein n=1 Tax=Rana temporaria TaxID=8407 RepID=UPI001AAD8C29|nr:migration and invasion-inhibitory protein [Rana temporaria]XP_040182326.1 migration and invasion-inhibitory protein [Rana temporaria]XP_040182327.1 migration and invasion-inhibitory protein [Rana temporaria]
MSTSGELEELRRLNKSLLERLARKQDQFRKQNPANRAEPSRDQDGGTARVWKDRPRINRKKDPPLSANRGFSSLARKGHSTPKRTCRVESLDPLGSTFDQTDVSSHGLHHSSSEKVGTGDDVIRIRSPVKRLTNASSMADVSPDLEGDPPPFTRQYVDHLMDEGNMRAKEPRTPKSILVTPNRTPKRDHGRVTFLSSSTPPHSNQWTGHPLLGYDLIAGLLEVNSGVTNKPDEFFSDISEFRRVNKEECIHDLLSRTGQEESSESEEEPDLTLDTHQCVYCYRVNSRLFISPLGAESACPVCKKRRGRRRTTLDEPAYVRVSIPRSTLLPAYKYRAHRRNSFDPTDTLALPSHCLAGWENAVPSCDLRVSSLDLKTSVEPSARTVASSANVTMDSASYYASRARSENLLNLSRSITFHHNDGK